MAEEKTHDLSVESTSRQAWSKPYLTLLLIENTRQNLGGGSDGSVCICLSHS